MGANLGDDLASTLMIFKVVTFSPLLSFILKKTSKKLLRHMKRLFQCQRPLQSHQDPLKRVWHALLSALGETKNYICPLNTLNIEKLVPLIS